MNDLHDIKMRLIEHILEAEKVIGGSYTVSIFAKHKDNPKAHLFLSRDTEDDIMKAMDEISSDSESFSV